MSRRADSHQTPRCARWSSLARPWLSPPRTAARCLLQPRLPSPAEGRPLGTGRTARLLPKAGARRSATWRATREGPGCGRPPNPPRPRANPPTRPSRNWTAEAQHRRDRVARCRRNSRFRPTSSVTLASSVHRSVASEIDLLWIGTVAPPRPFGRRSTWRRILEIARDSATPSLRFPRPAGAP